MSKAGFHGWGVVAASVLAVACARPVAPGPTVAKAPPPAKVEPTTLPEPALTPAPTAIPGAVTTLDLGRLLASLNHGTSATLEPSLFSAVWAAPGARLDAPIIMGSAGLNGADPVIVSALEPGTKLKFGPFDVDLDEHGLAPLADGCAVNRSSSVPRLFCGTRQRLLAYGPALRMDPRPLPEGVVLQARFNAKTPEADQAVYGLRSSVPRWVGALVPEASGPSKNGALVTALMDTGFEVASRVAEAYERLSRAALDIGVERDGRVPVRLALSIAGGPAEKLIVGTAPARVPRGFWALPRNTEQAVVFDSSLIAPLLLPSPRQLRLLSDARAGNASYVDQLVATSTSCLSSGRAVTYAVVSGRTWVGVEDVGGKCQQALAALFADAEGLGAVAVQPEPNRSVAHLEPPQRLPKSVKLLRFGTGKNARFLGLAGRQDVSWLVGAADAEALTAALVELLASGPKHRDLRSRPELAELGRAPALIAGFTSDDAWATPSVGVAALAAGDAKSPPPGDDRRIAFTVTHVGDVLQLDGSLSGQAFRARVAKGMGDVWGSFDYRKLSESKRRAALQIVEGSCRLGYGNACNLIGLVNAEAQGQAKDLATGVRFLELGCASGSGMACTNLAFYGRENPAEQLPLFRKSCDLGTALGCAFQGARLLDAEKASDPKLGTEKLQAGCDGKVGWACARLGLSYVKGVGVAKDTSRAADYQERACLFGYGTGCVLLGHAYATGDGRAADPSSAFQAYQAACKLDRAEGCYALALAHANGIGTPKNPAAAREQLNVACEAKHAEACRRLAEMTEEP